MKFSMTSLAMISTFTLASSAVFAFDPLVQDQNGYWAIGTENGLNSNSKVINLPPLFKMKVPLI